MRRDASLLRLSIYVCIRLYTPVSVRIYISSRCVRKKLQSFANVAKKKTALKQKQAQHAQKQGTKLYLYVCVLIICVDMRGHGGGSCMFVCGVYGTGGPPTDAGPITQGERVEEERSSPRRLWKLPRRDRAGVDVGKHSDLPRDHLGRISRRGSPCQGPLAVGARGRAVDEGGRMDLPIPCVWSTRWCSGTTTYTCPSGTCWWRWPPPTPSRASPRIGSMCRASIPPCMPRPCLWSETSGACARPGRMEHGGGEGAQSERARQRSTSAKVCGDCTFGALASSVQRLCLLPSRRYVRTWPPAGPTCCHGRLWLSSSDSRGGLRCGPLTGSWWRGGWTPRGSNRSSRCLSDKISNDTVLWPMQTASS